MIERIIMYIWKVRYDHYSAMGSYYLDKAKGFNELERFEELEECLMRVNKYTTKQYGMMTKLMGLA